MMKLPIVMTLAVLASSGDARTVPVPYVSSDAWIRSGPSTSHQRLTGLPRGTAVLAVEEPDLLLVPLSGRWVRVRVLEGRAEGREGWVWGRFVVCCKDHVWLEPPTTDL